LLLNNLINYDELKKQIGWKEFIQYFGGNAGRKVERKVTKKLSYLLVDMWSRDSVDDIATNLRSG